MPNAKPPAADYRLISGNRGFTLVEIMVALLIGMFGIIVMLQVFALSEGQKRSATGTGDAQSTGAIALHALQKDIKQAGFGLADSALLGCNLSLPLVGANAPALGRAASTLNALAPLTINHASIPAGDANTDTLLIVYGNGNGSPQGYVIGSQFVATEYPISMADKFITAGDRVVATPPTRATPCALSLDTVQLTDNTKATVTTGVANVSNGVLFSFGRPAPTMLAYAVRGGNLTVCDHMQNDCFNAGNTGDAAVWTPVANNVVSLRAEYGSDTTTPLMDGIVDAYNQSTPTTVCGWARISAVRLVLVARNTQYEKTAVTAAAPTWAGSTSATSVPVVLTGNADWQNYRYKTFETTIPLRNVTWMGAPSGC